MGPELGFIQFELFQQCAWLHVKWGDYVVLFGTDEERIAVLNKAAHGYFYMLQEVLFEDLIIHICRMSDPVKVSGRETLSVRRLLQAADPSVRDRVKALLDVLDEKTKFAKDWRNRHIGHHDYNLARGSARPLDVASRKGIREAIEAITEVINCVEDHYCGGAVIYDTVAPQLAGATKLLHVLRRAVESWPSLSDTPASETD